MISNHSMSLYSVSYKLTLSWLATFTLWLFLIPSVTLIPGLNRNLNHFEFSV